MPAWPEFLGLEEYTVCAGLNHLQGFPWPQDCGLRYVEHRGGWVTFRPWPQNDSPAVKRFDKGSFCGKVEGYACNKSWDREKVQRLTGAGTLARNKTLASNRATCLYVFLAVMTVCLDYIIYAGHYSQGNIRLHLLAMCWTYSLSWPQVKQALHQTHLWYHLLSILTWGCDVMSLANGHGQT